MLCFITPLRSPKMSDNWPRICGLFERTATSVFRQTTPDFRHVVVCHEPPPLKRTFDRRLEFITGDFPLPEKSRPAPSLTHDAWPAMSDDKLNKLVAGLQRARELNSDFVMLLDADDLVSRRLVAHVLSHPTADGWFVERGWRYEYGRQWIETLDGFNQVSSSCNVLARRWFSFPGHPERERDADAALIMQGHGQAVEAFAARGAMMRPLPFRAAVYTENGENMSILMHEHMHGRRPQPRGHPLRRLLGRCKRGMLAWSKRRPCTPALRAEFALDPSLP
jgi:hypothetical protein